jgi:hypothetical protein
MADTITVRFALRALLQALNVKAIHSADDPDQIDHADCLFRRIAELREAFR